MPHANQAEDAIWGLVSELPDPEIPVLTLTDLGIIRWIKSDSEETVVGVAPTYSACPATEVIEASVLQTLRENGYANARVERVLSPPWSTDWINESGRRKLEAYGIAPPDEAAESKRALFQDGHGIGCPRCKSTDTQRVSGFGSTPCKAAYKCLACLEPFEYFKCL